MAPAIRRFSGAPVIPRIEPPSAAALCAPLRTASGQVNQADGLQADRRQKGKDETLFAQRGCLPSVRESVSDINLTGV